MSRSWNIRILYTDGCPATPKTVELVRECVSELGLRVELTTIPVRTQEEAREWRFLGSPTVQVNGVDIDPAVRGSRQFGFL